MPAQVFYRKWRSQRFAELVGQEHVTRTLRNAVRHRRFAHAYLFCGPRGVGKTSAARILARAANCEQPEDGEPCGTCDLCVAMAEGRLLDVIEIDAASNRQIDDVRDLRERIHFAPTQARYKFYILDEAHMLTTEAFNALLKTLEEPPPHAIFILVTTDAQKLPPTIMSRCQRFDFRRVALAAMIERLNHICDAEQIAIAPDALHAVARAATGSLRDAESLLDQLVAAFGRELTLEHVRLTVGLAGTEATHRLVSMMAARDLAGGLRLINDLHVEGIDLRRFAVEVADYLRGVLLVRISGDLADLVEAPPETIGDMRELASQVRIEWLAEAIRIFSQIETAPRTSAPPQLPLELAFLDATLGDTRARTAGEETTRPIDPAPAVGPRAAEPPIPRRLRPDVDEANASDPPPIRRRILRPAPESSPPSPLAPASLDGQPPEPEAEPVPVGAPASSPGSMTLAQIQRQWSQALDAFGSREQRRIQALLRAARPIDYDDGTIVLGFKYPFHRDMIEETRNRHVVERVLSEQFGQRILIRCTLGTGHAPDLPQPDGPGPADVAGGSDDPIEMATADPRVQAAVRLGWRITRVTGGDAGSV